MSYFDARPKYLWFAFFTTIVILLISLWVSSAYHLVFGMFSFGVCAIEFLLIVGFMCTLKDNVDAVRKDRQQTFLFGITFFSMIGFVILNIFVK